MTLFHISRYLQSSNRPIFSFTKILSFSTSADKYYTHLQNNTQNLEKSLYTIKEKLDPSCINNVLKRCSHNHPILGLRFFIWAGLHPTYRHSSHMYKQADTLLNISKNPKFITDVIEGFQNEGCFVSVKGFKVVLNLCRQANLANEALWVLRKMKEFRCRPDTTAYNVVIRLFVEKGDMDVAHGLMKEMGATGLYPDMITYVVLVKGFCDKGRLEEACGLFKVMSGHGCSPNLVLYSTILDGFARFGGSERALKFLEEMEKLGGDCCPNVVMYTSVIQSFCDKGRTNEALAILDRMEANGCKPSRITVRTLINGICVKDGVEEAYKLIDRIVESGSVSKGDCYSYLVVALLRMGKLEEAEKLFKMMLSSEMKPSGLASSLLMREICCKGRLLDAFGLLDEIENLGCGSSIDSEIYSILLGGLCKESRLVAAAKLAEIMAQRGIQLKAPYVDDVLEHLKSAGETELVSHITNLGKL